MTTKCDKMQTLVRRNFRNTNAMTTTDISKERAQQPLDILRKRQTPISRRISSKKGVKMRFYLFLANFQATYRCENTSK